MSLFVSVNSNISVKNQSRTISNPVLYKNYNKADENTIYFLFERPYTELEYKNFRTLLENKYPTLKYAFISSIMLKVTEKDFKTQIIKFYKRNRTNLEELIPPNSKVITIGRALYAITQSDDLLPSDFIDEITFKTSFYSSDLKSEIFPIFSLELWLTKDFFERIFSLSQIEKCMDTKIQKRRIRDLIHYNVDNTSKFFNDFKDVTALALDTETDSLDWRTNRIGDLTIAFNNREGYHMFWKDVNPKELSDFLRDKKIITQNGKFDAKTLITKEVERDSIYLIDIWNMQHVWKEDNSHSSLKSGAWRLTNYGGYDRSLDEYKNKHRVKSYIDDIPDEIRIPYAIDDAIVTFTIYEELNKIFDFIDKTYPLNNGWGIKRYFYEIVTPAVNTFLDVELNGWYINYEELKIMSKELRQEINQIEEEIYKAFNIRREQLNLYSGDQLGEFIQKLGWKIEDYGKKGIPLTNDECLQRWKKQGHREAELLLRLREKDALMKTFVGEENKEKKNGYYQYIVKEENSYKIYPSILPMLANSGRSKHRRPNSANIPAHGKNAFFVRRMFQPPSEDYVFLSADAAGLQLRIAGLLSKDKIMRDIFINQGGDMHSKTAETLFGNIISYRLLDNGKIDLIKGKKEGYKHLKFEDFVTFKKTEEIVKNFRFKSKSFNFGLLFGASAYTIRTNNIEPEWSERDCEEYIEVNNLNSLYEKLLEKAYEDREGREAEKFAKTLTVANDTREKFFNTYKGLVEWIESLRKTAKELGYVRSIYGAFRRLPQLMYIGNHSDKKYIANLLNIALNSPVQNVESVIMNRWMTSIHKFIKKNNMKSYFIGAIHDAVEMIVYKPELNILIDFMKKEFERDFPEYEGIPFEIEGNIADYFKTYKTDRWEVWDIGHDWSKYLIA